MSNFRIRTRVALIAAIPIVGLLILAGVQFRGDQIVETAFNSRQEFGLFETRMAAVEADILTMRRQGKEFLALRDTKFSDSYRRQAGQVANDLSVIAAMPEAEAVGGAVKQLRDLVARHGAEFETLVKSRVEAGLNQDSGLEGELRKKVHAVESELDKLAVRNDSLMVQMLTLRRHEKDYIMRGDPKYIEKHDGALAKFEATLMLSDLDGQLKLRIKDLIGDYGKGFHAWADADLKAEDQAKRLDAIGAQSEPVIEELKSVAQRGAVTAAASLDETRAATSMISMLIVPSLLAVILLLAYVIGRSILRPLRDLTGSFARLAEGHLNIEIGGQSQKDEIGDLARNLAGFQSVSTQAARMQSALEAASANFMISDTEGKILALNQSAQAMFRAAEFELQRALPGFKSDDLTGASVDLFRQGLTAELAAVRSERLVIGPRTYDLVLVPVLSRLGEMLGTAIEWRDVTQQLAMEKEVAGIVHAAGEGDFTRRLAETGKDGFMLDLTRGMNELAKTVEAGINGAVKVVSALADGDLTQSMSGNFKGTFLTLLTDVNRMGDQMRSIAGRIGAAANSVQGATREIGSGVADLSGRTEQQASSLEETAASMEELSATVRQNSGNAQEANQLAAAARQLAAGGGEIAGRAIAAMDKIEQSSRQVSDIVGLIQEIAFQTNILALNAAVEAARAGEAGRGFAVVANEVRALAQRSSQASKDIKALIVNTDGNVKEGVDLVKQAGSSLTEIVTSVRKVADIVSEIAAASQEQSAGIDQVSKAIANMDEMTQQNAALVEETNAALHSAQSQADELRQAVSFFKTGEAAPAPAYVPAPKPAMPARSPAAHHEPNQVHQKLNMLAQKISARMSPRAAAAGNGDWKEF